MPKKLSYPSASFKNALELSEEVYELKNCKAETCAAKMGKRVSGAFNTLINGAVKYGMIVRKNGVLSPSEVYRNYKLSYDDSEKSKHLQGMFFLVPLFAELFEKFKGGKVPIEILSTMLIKEYGVDDKHAGKVAGYFVAGAKQIGILSASNTLTAAYSSAQSQNGEIDSCAEAGLDVNTELQAAIKNEHALGYLVRFSGPDKLDITLSLKCESDFLVLEAVVQKIKNSISDTAA